MRFSLAITALLGSVSAIKLQKAWPSVARCVPGQTSTNQNPCDQTAPPNHLNRHDDVTGNDPPAGAHVPHFQAQLERNTEHEWPSVARCAPGQISTDKVACDHAAPPNHIHPHDNVVGVDPAAFAQWPSVARCVAGQTSTDQNPCDQAQPPAHIHNHHDVAGLDAASKAPVAHFQLQISAEEAADIVASWPSVARCVDGEVPSDEFPCDHANAFLRHNHDGTIGRELRPDVVQNVQTESEYRPMIKCKEPSYGNPVTCDLDDVTDLTDDHKKDVYNMTPVKEILGGPTVNNDPPVLTTPKGQPSGAGVRKEVVDGTED